MSPRLPLCSSNQVIRMLEREGFEAGAGSGSHRSYTKTLSDGRKITTVVVLGKKEMPRGTLRNTLKLAEVPEERFLKLLR